MIPVYKRSWEDIPIVSYIVGTGSLVLSFMDCKVGSSKPANWFISPLRELVYLVCALSLSLSSSLITWYSVGFQRKLNFQNMNCTCFCFQCEN
jgi:hypothetical protein